MQLTGHDLQSALEGPALEAPKDSAFQLGDPWERDNTLYYVMAVCMSVQCLMITTRIYTQININKNLEIADRLCPLMRDFALANTPQVCIFLSSVCTENLWA
jgi:hypothetical protein